MGWGEATAPGGPKPGWAQGAWWRPRSDAGPTARSEGSKLRSAGPPGASIFSLATGAEAQTLTPHLWALACPPRPPEASHLTPACQLFAHCPHRLRCPPGPLGRLRAAHGLQAVQPKPAVPRPVRRERLEPGAWPPSPGHTHPPRPSRPLGSAVTAPESIYETRVKSRLSLGRWGEGTEGVIGGSHPVLPCGSVPRSLAVVSFFSFLPGCWSQASVEQSARQAAVWAQLWCLSPLQAAGQSPSSGSAADPPPPASRGCVLFSLALRMFPFYFSQ